MTQRQQVSLKTHSLKIVEFRMSWIVWPYSESYPEETKYIKEKIYQLSCNTIKQIAFENVYESSIIFQSFLYAKIPAESSSYAAIFLR